MKQRTVARQSPPCRRENEACGTATETRKRSADRLLRPRRLLAAGLRISAQRRPPVAAFIAAGEQGAEHDHQGDTAKLQVGGPPIGFRSRWHGHWPVPSVEGTL